MYTLSLMDVVSIPMSLDEFFARDEVLVELVEGQPVVSPAPAARHQQVLIRLIQLLLSACPDEFELLPAPIDWVLWSDPLPTVRQPDLLVARRDNDRGIRITEPPVLVIEIVFETSIERDLVAKRRDYATAGRSTVGSCSRRCQKWFVSASATPVTMRKRAGRSDGNHARLSRPFRSPSLPPTCSHLVNDGTGCSPLNLAR
jgi:Putative restriction endonuclease